MNQHSRFGLLAAGLIVFLLASASPVRAQDAEAEAGQIMEELIALLNQQADVLATIKDQESAQAALPKLQRFQEQAVNLRSRALSVGRLTRAQDRRVQRKYESRLKDAIQRVIDEVRRIRAIQGLPMDAELARLEENISRYGISGAAAAGDRSALAFLFPVLLFLIFLACVGFLYAEGMWGNAVQLINVVTAALLATNFWEPLARFLENNISKALSYFWDFIALWVLFVVFLMIFRTLTGFASRVKVRFLGIVDRIGGIFFAVLIGWVILCFTTMTLHTAPLARNFMFGGFDPDKKMMLGLAPDLQWLGFMQRMSRGSFCRTASEDEREQYPPRAEASDRELKMAVFDGGGQFVLKYATRRAALDSQVKAKHTSLAKQGVPNR